MTCAASSSSGYAAHDACRIRAINAVDLGKTLRFDHRVLSINARSSDTTQAECDMVASAAMNSCAIVLGSRAKALEEQHAVAKPVTRVETRASEHEITVCDGGGRGPFVGGYVPPAVGPKSRN